MGLNIMKALSNPKQFVEDAVKKVEGELLAIDKDHNGIPDLKEEAKKVQDAVTRLEAFAAKIDYAKFAAAVGVAETDVKIAIADIGAIKTSAMAIVTLAEGAGITL